MDTDTLATLFKYKRWIDIETLQAIKNMDPSVNAEKRHLTLRLMNHIHVVDMIFRANITGQKHAYTALNTPETPSADELLITMTECTDWYIHHIHSLFPDDLAENIKFQFVDGGAGEMKAIDMLNHVLYHGTYHRGAVGWLLSESRVTPPRDVLTVFLRDHNHASTGD
ncbi:DinB family protein [Pantoea sp. KPR_PJ]|uniref:DinB family protein n=1 Tax=Pantoea sp. KPR_PJ TaxID=2738375 RepID=UPI00352984AA